MTYATLLNDSPYAITTEAIVRLDPSPGRRSIPPSGTASKPEPVDAPHIDEASISHASLLLAHALTLTDVRADRVAQLQQAIATGTYRLPAAAIAEKLIQTLEA